MTDRVTTAHALPRLLVALMMICAAEATEPPAVQGEGALTYVGDTARLGISVSDGSRWRAEWLGVLAEQDRNAWLGRAWWGRRSGGLQGSFHRVSGDWVEKFFAAYDRNAEGDAKFTVGMGLESERWFGSLAFSQRLTGRRLIDIHQLVQVSERLGQENDRPYLDTLTTTTTTRTFERAYDYGVGLRFGRDWSEHGLRASGGVDQEWGRDAAKQLTLTLELEKRFTATPHSVGLRLEHYRKQGGADTRRTDDRLWLNYRYDLGRNGYRPERLVRLIQVPDEISPASLTPPAQAETRIVKTTVSMASDAFFEFGKAELTETARNELSRIAGLLKQQGREGNLRITGHGCDIGTDAANLKISQRRAEMVRDHLVALGVMRPDEAIVQGLGKRSPRYPAKPETRHLNRRVDIEFVTYESREERVEPASPVPAVAHPEVKIVREEIQQEPAWLRRALRQPVAYKEAIDTYRIREAQQTRATQRTWINRAPVVRAGQYSAIAGVPAFLPVLSLAIDPDGDALIVSNLGAASVGQVSLEGGQVRYVAPAGFAGTDQFSFRVRDPSGVEAEGRVTVTVSLPNRAPVARDDTYFVSGFLPASLDVLANDQDPDGDHLTIVSVTQPVGGAGTVRIVGDRIEFTPRGPFYTDDFTYTIRDAGGLISTATVHLIDP